MKKRERIIGLLKDKIAKSLQDCREHDPSHFLRSCHVYFKFLEEPFNKKILQNAIVEAAEEYKAMIDELVHNVNDTLMNENNELVSPQLMRIHCPACDEDANLIGNHEVYCYVRGISLYSYDYEPITYDVNSEDERKPEYECSKCDATFSYLDAHKLKEQYRSKYAKLVETDIDLFKNIKKED